MLLPFLCLLGAALLVRIIPRHRFNCLFLVMAALAVVLEPTLRIIKLDRLLASPDTRLIAGAWMKEHISPKSGVIFIQPTIFGRPDEFFRYPNRISLPAQAGVKMLRRITGVSLPEDKYTVISEHPLAYSDLDPEIKSLLEDISKEVYTIRGGGGDSRNVIYDPFDAFYLPLAGFAGINLPGPDIRIFYTDSGRATHLHRRDAESAENKN